MKSQYPEQPITYQNSEPQDYLQTYCGIRQISVEKAENIKLQCKQQDIDHMNSSIESANLNKGEEDGLASFFYIQSFIEEDF
jgi:hypothetical protein